MLMLMLIQCTNRRWVHKVSALDEHQHQYKCTGFESFLEQQDLRMYWPNSCRTGKKSFICSCLWKIIHIMPSKYHLLWGVLTPLLSEKMDQLMWQSHARSHIKTTSRSLDAVRRVYLTFSMHSAYLLKSQSENKTLGWSVWIQNKLHKRLEKIFVNLFQKCYFKKIV